MKNLQRSIRFRLTLYYSLIVGATLLGFAVASYFYTEQNLLSSLDRSLYQEVVTIINFIEPQAKKVRLKKQRPRQKLQSSVDRKSAAETVRRSNEVEMKNIDSSDVEFDELWNKIYEHSLQVSLKNRSFRSGTVTAISSINPVLAKKRTSHLMIFRRISQSLSLFGTLRDNRYALP